MATPSVQGSVREAIDQEAQRETQRTVLREAIRRFNHELMGDEERMLLQDWITRLRKQLGLS